MKPVFTQILDKVKACRLCGRAFTNKQIKLIERTKTATVAHATCSECHHATIVFLGKTNHGIGFLGLSTDLNGADAEHFKDAAPVSEKTLFAAHHLLTTDSRSLVSHLFYQNLL